jgi:energy-coupling factor transporter ATP-binding protein EcfA2
LVGEESNCLAAYLACTSRKLEKPLAVIIQSTSAAGKSTLMEAVLAMFPEEDRIKYSAMTGQSLFYLCETDLKFKILAIVEEEGAEKASYALKLLQSEGELTIASTGKNPQTGRMETQEYHVEGPVMIFLTTTSVEIDEELQNRCLILTVDESREQTERIHAMQHKARTLEGLRMKMQRRRVLTLMRNAQRLLEPVDVMNPWAEDLTFTTEQTRTRRDNEKYLGLIEAIAFLHQHQRPRKQDAQDTERSEFIRVTLEDIELANRLAREILGRSLDEMPPQSRRLLEIIKGLVRATCKDQHLEQRLALISRRNLQAACGWSYSQIKRHLWRLQELEYVAPRLGRMGTTLKYELLIDADEPDGVAHIGLLDVEKLGKSTTTTTTWTGSEATLTPPCQNEMARLSPAIPRTKRHLATLPERTSGAPLVAVIS